MATKRNITAIPENRKFGFELEYVRGNNDTLTTKFNQAGLAAQNRRGYCHSNGTKWDFKVDMSAGKELASPILIGTDGITKAKQATAILNEELTRQYPGQKQVNTSCGMHVHVDVSDLTPLQLGNLVKLFHKFEDQMFSVVPESRSRNTYCSRIRSCMHSENDFNIWARGWASDGSQRRKVSRWNSMFGRFTALNLQNLPNRGTVEFRFFGGTTDYNKVAGNIMLCLRLVQTAIELKRTTHKSKATKTDAFEMFLYGLNLYGKVVLDDSAKELRSYLRLRNKTLGRRAHTMPTNYTSSRRNY